MAISMTGYGRGEAHADGRAVALEVKTVNHRYFEAAFKLPPGLQGLEPALTAQLRKAIRRGRVDVYLHPLTPIAGTRRPVVDQALAQKYLTTLKAAGHKLGLAESLDLHWLIQLPEVVRLEEGPIPVKAVADLASAALQKALDQLALMRKREGRKLAADIGRRVKRLQQAAQRIGRLFAASQSRLEEKLQRQLKQWLGPDAGDVKRQVQEAGVKLIRSDITEELVRLDSHFQQLNDFLGRTEPMGRKIDFLIQEINREINTIGSKSQDSGVAHEVVGAKEELEKIREQAANLE